MYKTVLMGQSNLFRQTKPFSQWATQYKSQWKNVNYTFGEKMQITVTDSFSFPATSNIVLITLVMMDFNR